MWQYRCNRKNKSNWIFVFLVKRGEVYKDECIKPWVGLREGGT